MKKILVIMLALLTVFTLVGCSNNTADDEPVEPTEERKLVIYSPNSDTLIAAAETFGEMHDVEIEILTKGTGECLESIVAEKDNPQADVIYGGVNYANAINYTEYFMEYTAQGNDSLPEAYRNPNGYATYYGLDGSAALLVNTAELAKVGLTLDDIKGYADLLRPELKADANGQKIAMGDAAASSSAWAELTNMLLVMGDEPYDDKAWDYVKQFCGQLSGILGSSSAIYKGVANGEYVVGVSYEDPCVKLLIDGAPDLALVYPEEGAVWLPAGSSIIANCKHPNTAKEFMDWLISDEGQKEIAKSTCRPVNPDIPNVDKELIPFSQIKVAYEDIPFCGEHKTEWQAKFAEIFEENKQNY